MVDSLKILDSDVAKRIHSRSISGRLHKGHGIVAATASIPSKYQTIFVDNSEHKGFNSRAKRFQYEASQGDNPGPGSYLSHVKDVENKSSSYSKKGTGGFASKDRRILKHDAGCSPGAGTYNIPSTIITKRDFNKAETTRTFHSPIARQLDKTNGFPAPNQYSVLDTLQKTCKSNNVTANAAFKSRSRREFFDTKSASEIPSPWHYQVNDSLLHQCVKVPISSFKSTSIRKMSESPSLNPGPGTYNPGEETLEDVKRLQFPRKHYLCISAPAMPLPNPLPGPGPGSYELVNYDGIPKHYMSSGVFVSNTSRWTASIKQAAIPGPAHYRPSSFGKQSFIFNSAGRWI